MAQREFSDLTDRLAASVPGCPIPVMINYIRDAAIEACERTLAWRYIQPLLRLTPGVYDYPYETPTGTEVHAILIASINKQDIKAITLEQAASYSPGFPSDDVALRGAPRALVHIDPDTFYVVPAPNSDPVYDLQAVVALKPLRTVTSMDKAAFDELETVILHCAAQHLLVLPDRPWSDRELAAYHAKQYIFKVSERRARVNVGAGRAVLTVQSRPWA